MTQKVAKVYILEIMAAYRWGKIMVSSVSIRKMGAIWVFESTGL